jgi:hypothetical protein
VALRLAGLLFVLLALGAAACGGDEEAADTPKPPRLTVPGGPTTEETETEPSDETTPTPAPQQDTGSGGASPVPPQQTPDSPQNDVPPEPGTPESRFEKFCRENPGACG